MYNDYDPIIPNQLYQGSFPPVGDALSREHGFDVVVLCAFENPNQGQYTDIEVIEAIGDDVEEWPIDEESLVRWQEAAKLVADRIKEGKRVLVTCVAGLNRSGIVTAMALNHIYGWSGDRACTYVQSKRQSALFRKAFRRHLTGFVMERT